MRKHFKNERHLGEASLVYYPPIWHAGIEIYYEATARAQDFPVEEFPRLGPPFLPSYFKHKKAKAGRKWRIAFRAGIPNHSADTPRELPGLLVNLSSRGPHITGAALPILWKSVIATVLGGQGDIAS